MIAASDRVPGFVVLSAARLAMRVGGRPSSSAWRAIEKFGFRGAHDGRQFDDWLQEHLTEDSPAAAGALPDPGSWLAFDHPIVAHLIRQGSLEAFAHAWNHGQAAFKPRNASVLTATHGEVIVERQYAEVVSPLRERFFMRCLASIAAASVGGDAEPLEDASTTTTRWRFRIGVSAYCSSAATHAAGPHVVSKVLGQLCPKHGGVAGVVATASALHISARSLQRRLAEVGWTHRDLIAQRICRQAMETLRCQPRSDLETVAQSCGFVDSSHMRRVFLRHVGMSPAAWRNFVLGSSKH